MIKRMYKKHFFIITSQRRCSRSSTGFRPRGGSREFPTTPRRTCGAGRQGDWGRSCARGKRAPCPCPPTT